MISRRPFLYGMTAMVASPMIAQSNPWEAVGAQAAALDQCHALSIAVDGQTVFAEAFRGPALGRAVPIKSVSKTVVAALLGAALDRAEIPDVNATLGEVAPGLIPSAADARVADITMADLVTMQAGLERTSGANYGEWVSSRDWVADALSRPMVAEPGSRMLYSTGSFHILGAVLSKVAGQSLLTLARRRLGEPLGIDIPSWTRDPQGRYLGGNEMSFSHDAMLRFGEMYRQGGTFRGQQVLSADWVGKSLQTRTRSFFSGLEYGYGWFLGQTAGEPFALARGYGGQIICIVPGLSLTIALTSDPMRSARSGGYFSDIMRLLTEAIVPAARALRA